MELSFDELWQRLIVGDESVMIEAKRATEISTSVMETVNAFANEPNRGGGYLILGVALAESALFPTYEVVGVSNPEKLQSDLATQCRGIFNGVVRPEIEIVIKDKRPVVLAFIPEAQPQDKPLFFQSRGLPRGAFRRIGPTDHCCTDDDIELFFQQRSHHSFDETAVVSCEISDLDPTAIEEYRRSRRDANPDAPELGYGDAELLRSLKCATVVDDKLKPTIAGIILFGSHAALRREFPMMRVDYVRVSGKEWVRDPDHRFESIEHLGPLMLVIPRIVNAVLDDIPQAFRLTANDDQRTDVPLIPRSAIREAVVNALMHRSYRQKSPVQIIRYANRIEFRNPGHSLVPDDRLGEPGSTTRNEKIAAVLHETRYAETKGSGIRAMREAMSIANLSPPLFESDRERDTFVATFLFHHFLSADDSVWLGLFADHALTTDEQKALVFVREVSAINNLAYRNINRVDTLTASGHLRRLRQLGLLEQKGKGSQTYYVPTTQLLNPEKHGLPPRATTGTTRRDRKYIPETTERELLLNSLPNEVQDVVKAMTHPLSSSASDLRAIVLEILRAGPQSSKNLSLLMRRTQNYLRSRILRPMIEEGLIASSHPANPSHPETKYVYVRRQT